MENKKLANKQLIVIIVVCLALMMLMIGISKYLIDINKQDKQYEQKAEEFAKIMYTVKKNESFNGKKEKVKGLITEKLSDKLFSQKDNYNIYNDITVKKIKTKPSGDNIMLEVIQTIPLELRTENKTERTLKAELKFVKQDDRWLIDEFRPVSNK